MQLEGIDDPEIGKKVSNISNAISKMENILENMLNEDWKDELSLKDRLNHDLFMAYMLNTLYWCYLRTNGIDPNGKKVKEELQRVKDYMIKAKKAIDRHTIRPMVNQPVAERFVRHGIQKPGKHKQSKEDTGTKNKKIKFDV